MADLNEQVRAAAQALIAAAGMFTAVQATDIRSRAEVLHREYGLYSKVHISEKIAAEIKQRHNPGISGSV